MTIRVTGIDAAMRAVEEQVPKTVGKLAVVADQSLVSSTPVKEGRARSNWIPTIGAPAVGEVSPSQVDSTGGASIAATKELARNLKGYPVFYLTNNVPYISVLNRGSSAQAPAGFVDLAVQAAIASVK